MTSAGLHGNATSIGWLTSLSLHTVLAFAALAFAQRVTFFPHVPFTWQVAMVATSADRVDPSAAPFGDPDTSQQTMHSSASLRSDALDTRVMPRGVLPIAAQPVSKSPLPHAPAPVEPADESTQETDSEAATDFLTGPYDRQAEGPAEPDPVPVAAPAQNTPIQPEGLSPGPTTPIAAALSSPTRPDYTWLSETILRRMEELKKYPAEARLNQAQGNVVLKAVIRNDGSVQGVEIAQSSGYHSLDQAALELLKMAGPFQLSRPLEKSQLIVKIPMSYRLQ